MSVKNGLCWIRIRQILFVSIIQNERLIFIYFSSRRRETERLTCNEKPRIEARNWRRQTDKNGGTNFQRGPLSCRHLRNHPFSFFPSRACPLATESRTWNHCSAEAPPTYASCVLIKPCP